MVTFGTYQSVVRINEDVTRFDVSVKNTLLPQVDQAVDEGPRDSAELVFGEDAEFSGGKNVCKTSILTVIQDLIKAGNCGEERYERYDGWVA